MKKITLVLLASLMLTLSGCEPEQNTNADNSAALGNSTAPEKIVYLSDTSAEDCYLCGGGIEDIIPSSWGQNNVALISLNTFEIRPIEINRYRDGQMVEEYAGYMSLTGGRSNGDGFSSSMMLEHDRGFANGTIDFNGDEILDLGKAASFLCAECLNKLLQHRAERCFGVGAIDLTTKEIHMFENDIVGFGLGDFYFNYRLNEWNNGLHRMSFLVFFCPIRYKSE